MADAAGNDSYARSTTGKLFKIAQQIPASAQILAQLGQLLMDVNSGLEEIARLLRRDTALAAQVFDHDLGAYGITGTAGVSKWWIWTGIAWTNC